MRRLLRADFSRLWRNKTFWLCMGVMLIYALAYMLAGSRQAAADPSEYSYSLDEYYFHFALSIGFFCMLCSSMFFGTEYSDGTIRNKIIAGHTRINIYLASLITTFAAALLILSVWLAGALVAVPALGFWKMGALRLSLYLLTAVMFLLAFSAISAAVNLLSSNKVLTVLISVLLFLGLLLLASTVYNRLSEPEMISGVQITQNGLDMTEPTPNPNYIAGTEREICDLIVDFLPTGQGLRMWMLEITHPVRMILSSLFLTAAVTAGGIAAFQKKNIK